jgi:hypothetical protein
VRLNTRLIGWLHGILGLVVIGRVLTFSLALHPQSASAQPGQHPHRTGPFVHPALLPAFFLGCICIVAGSIGAFFARLIKGAVNRQREFLADAAAVQFTRNPSGIAGALIKIGGLRRQSIISAPRAEEASHVYFADGMARRWIKLVSTHPPLADRIRRIDADFNGTFPAVSMDRVYHESRVTALYREQARKKPLDLAKLVAALGPAAAAAELPYAQATWESAARQPVAIADILPRTPTFAPAHLEYARLFLNTLPESIRAATAQPFSAVALIYTMICAKDPDTRARQLADLSQTIEPGIAAEMSRLFPWFERLEEGAFLPLADLCLRPLRQLSATQYETFRENLRLLVENDRQIDLFEYALEHVLIRHLDPHFNGVRRSTPHYYALQPLLHDCAVLLSGLARIGHDTSQEVTAAFNTGASQLPPNPDLRLLPLDQCNLPQLDAAIHKTAMAAPKVKQQILNALACTLATDGLVKRREAELLRAIADAFDAPIPPFLRASHKPIAST